MVVRLYKYMVHLYKLVVHTWRAPSMIYKTLFGNEIAEFCLLYIANYGEGYIRGISSTFGVFPNQVRLQLEKLEAEGILVSQFSGNTKLFRINPRLAIKDELLAVLE